MVAVIEMVDDDAGSVMRITYNSILQGGASECVNGFGAGDLQFINATTTFARYDAM